MMYLLRLLTILILTIAISANVFAQTEYLRQQLDSINANHPGSYVKYLPDRLEKIETDILLTEYSHLSLYRCQFRMNQICLSGDFQCFILFSIVDSNFGIQKAMFYNGIDEDFWCMLNLDSTMDTTISSKDVMTTAMELFMIMTKEFNSKKRIFNSFDSILKHETFEFIYDPYPFFGTELSCMCHVYERNDMIFGNSKNVLGYHYEPRYIYSVAKDHKGITLNIVDVLEFTRKETPSEEE